RLGIFNDATRGGVRGTPSFSTELIAIRPIDEVNFRRPLFGWADRDEDPTAVFRRACHVTPPVCLVHRFSSRLAVVEVSPRHRERSTQTLHNPTTFDCLPDPAFRNAPASAMITETPIGNRPSKGELARTPRRRIVWAHTSTGAGTLTWIAVMHCRPAW